MKSPLSLMPGFTHAPGGLSVSELLARHPDLSRRTAQRQLAWLVDQGHLVARGQARARRYHAAVAPTGRQTTPLVVAEPGATPSPAVPDERSPDPLPLSPDSRDIVAHVTQPLSRRTPVGYQWDFLEAYEPNHSAYLPEPLRRQLHRIGATPHLEQPAGTYSRAILNRLLIDLSWASSHLEGNTYTRLDTLALITHGTAATGKAMRETQMILNHKAAIELLVANIDEVDFNHHTLMSLHALLAENLLGNPGDEGRIRQHAVDIGQSAYRPLFAPQPLEAGCALMLEKARQIHDPFEQSFFVMVHLPYLQPFADVNKRTARLLANLPLFKANLCPLTFLDVPPDTYAHAMLGVYEMTRIELLRDLYLWAYERSVQEYLTIRQNLAQPDPLRLAWRQLIRDCVHQVVVQRLADPLPFIGQAVAAQVPVDAQPSVQALIVEELRRLHEGVLARYGLRPAQWAAYRQALARMP